MTDPRRIIAIAVVACAPSLGCRDIVRFEDFPTSNSTADAAGVDGGGTGDGSRDAVGDTKAPCASYPSAVIADGAIAYFRFEGDVKDAIHDRSLSVDVLDGARYGTAGVAGSQFLDLTKAAAFAASFNDIVISGNQLTLEFWYRSTKDPVSIARLATSVWWMDVGQGGGDFQALSVTVATNSSPGADLPSGSPNGDRWHAAAIVLGPSIEGNSNDAQLTIYIDGGLFGSSMTFLPPSGNYELHLGDLRALAPATSSVTGTGGQIDELAVYGRALDGVTAQNHFAIGNCQP